MRMTLLSLLSAAVLSYAGACLYLYFTQRSQMYFPPPESIRSHPLAEVLRIPVRDAVLKVWALRASATPPAGALLYFGGNAEDVAANIDSFAARFPARAVYLVNYRGYAGSTGYPTESSLCADAEALFDAIRARHPGQPLAVIGRSLGSGVATHLASVRDVERLVLVTPFDSLVKVAQSHFGLFPVHWLMQDRYESLAKVQAGQLRAPTLVVIADDDEVVPAARGEALAAGFPAGQVEVLRLPGAQHNSIDLFPAYLDRVAAFLAASQT
jgi:uncharacterized protein